MTKCDLYISNEPPKSRNCAWLKPVKDGCILCVLFNGKWQPLKLANTEDVKDLGNSVIQNIVGSAKDNKNANTINGAKAYAEDVAKAIVGSKGDDSSDLTLYGLKSYIDSQIKSLE